MLLLVVAIALSWGCAGTSSAPTSTEAARATSTPATIAALATESPLAPTVVETPTATPAVVFTPTPPPTPTATLPPSPIPTPSRTPTPSASPTATATPGPTPGSPGADRVVAFNPGPGALARYGDPAALLGLPDLVEDPCCQGMVQLGRGGSVLLAFADNPITDGEGPDLQVYGESVGDDFLLVEVSADGQTWYAFPTVSESSGGLDLAAVGLEQAVYVRLTDVQPGTSTGAEVDAVEALHSAAALASGLPDLPDAVARRDLTLRAGPDKRMKKVGQVTAGHALDVMGTSQIAGWVQVEAEGSVSGWCPMSDLGLNVNLSDRARVQAPPTPTTEVAAAPTAAPGNRWLVFRQWQLVRNYGPPFYWPPRPDFRLVNQRTLKVSEAAFDIQPASPSEEEQAAADSPSPDKMTSRSPDGSWIAESSAKGRNDGIQELYLRRADGSGEVKLLGYPIVNTGPPVWSPDSRTVVITAFEGDPLYAIDVQTKKARVLYERTLRRVSGDKPGSAWYRPYVDQLTFGRRGLYFVALTDADGSGDLSALKDTTDIFVIQVDGSGLQNVTHTPDYGEDIVGWIGP